MTSVKPQALHAGLRIAVDPALPVRDAARVADNVRRQVHREIAAAYCFIELEPERQAAARTCGGETSGAA